MSDKDLKEKKLIKNTFWFAVGTLLSKVIMFLIVPFYTAILTTEEYGIADIISTSVSLAFPFFSLIITEAVMRFLLDKKGNEKDIFNFGFRIIFVGTIALVLISFPIFWFIPQIKDYWIYFILFYLFSSISTLESEFLKGQEKVKTLSIVNITYTIVFLGSNLLFLLTFKMAIKGYLLSFIVANLFSSILYFFAGKLYKYYSISKIEDNDLKKSMLKYSFPMIPNSAMWWITNSSDRYMVSFIISASATGILSIAYKIPSMLSIAIGVFMGAWQISVVDDFDNEKGKTFFKETYNKYNESLLIIAATLVVASKLLGKILYSADFFQAWKLSSILVIAFLFHSLAGFLGTVYTTVKKTRILFYSTLAGAVINLALNFLLINFWGVEGAVIATFASYFTTYLIRRLTIRKYIEIGKIRIRILLSYTSLFSCGILMYLDTCITIIIASALMVSIYALNYRFFISLIERLKKLIKRNK